MSSSRKSPAAILRRLKQSAPDGKGELPELEKRQEFTIGANWFFNGHNNKLTLDYSYLTIDDGALGLDDDGSRVRLQWDISF